MPLIVPKPSYNLQNKVPFSLGQPFPSSSGGHCPLTWIIYVPTHAAGRKTPRKGGATPKRHKIKNKNAGNPRKKKRVEVHTKINPTTQPNPFRPSSLDLCCHCVMTTTPAQHNTLIIPSHHPNVVSRFDMIGLRPSVTS